METEHRDLLFVLADEQHLTNAGALMHRIAQEALDQRKGANVLAGLAVAALEASRMKTAAQTMWYLRRLGVPPTRSPWVGG